MNCQRLCWCFQQKWQNFSGFKWWWIDFLTVSQAKLDIWRHHSGLKQNCDRHFFFFYVLLTNNQLLIGRLFNKVNNLVSCRPKDHRKKNKVCEHTSICTVTHTLIRSVSFRLFRLDLDFRFNVFFLLIKWRMKCSENSPT